MNDPLEQRATSERADAPGETARRSSWRALRDPLLIAVLLVTLAADQATKQLVLESLSLGSSWPDDGFFRFTFVRNDGTAFGLFQDNGNFFIVLSIIVVGLIVYFFREAAMASRFTRAALGLQVGGALGNLVDRFRHGYVVDFVDVGPWPIFNVADSAIITGIIGLIAYFTLLDGGRGESPAPPEDAQSGTDAHGDATRLSGAGRGAGPPDRDAG